MPFSFVPARMSVAIIRRSDARGSLGGMGGVKFPRDVAASQASCSKHDKHGNVGGDARARAAIILRSRSATRGAPPTHLLSG
jgi:hypothetical protein